MYGDSELVRRHVDRLREQAVDVRSLADQLVARTEALGWSGRAATALRERVLERTSHLRVAAARHESAAETLSRHVDAVDAVRADIAEVERRAAALVADARARLGRVAKAAGDDEAAEADGPGVRISPDPDDEVLAGFVPPAPGHRDWLTVDLPGL